MRGVKGKVSKTYFREMGIFFLDFVMQYFVDIFSEPPKSLFTNKFRTFLTNCHKKIDIVYLFMNINGIKGHLGRSSFKELVIFSSLRIL